MSLGQMIYRACLEQHLLLNRKGDDTLGVRRFGGPLAPELRRLLVDHKPEVLEFLAWLEEASQLLADTLAAMGRDHVPGCRLDSTEVRDADAQLHEAFWSEDRTRYARALERWRSAFRRATTAWAEAQAEEGVDTRARPQESALSRGKLCDPHSSCFPETMTTSQLGQAFPDGVDSPDDGHGS